MNETCIAEIRALADGPRYMRDATPLLAALSELLGEVERLTQEVASKDVRLQGSIEFGVSQHERAEAAEESLSHIRRFFSKVSFGDACWEWQAAKHGAMAYGAFCVDKKNHSAHRWIFEQLNGQLPPDLHVCHRCDNPSCVRPDHLFAGTRSDNMQDAADKGRNAMQRPPEQRFRLKKNVQPKGEAHGLAKLSASDVRAIRAAADSGENTKSIAQRFGIGYPHVRSIARRKAWAHISEIEES